MPFKFRKSVKIAPGVKVNISEKGARSVTVGGRRGRVNVSKNGTSVGASLGGGLSWSKRLGGRGGAPDTGEAPGQPERRPTRWGFVLGAVLVATVVLVLACSLIGALA